MEIVPIKEIISSYMRRKLTLPNTATISKHGQRNLNIDYYFIYDLFFKKRDWQTSYHVSHIFKTFSDLFLVSTIVNLM